MKKKGCYKYYKLVLTLTLVTIFSLPACHDGRDRVSDDTVISGLAAKGHINGATVTVTSYENGIENEELGSTVSKSDGSYSINIGSYSGPVMVTVSGGSYKDETTLLNTPLALPLRAMYGNVSSSVQIMVTPLTEEATRYALAKFGSSLTEENIDFANAKISHNCGFDIIDSSPADPTSEDSEDTSEVSKEYGIYLTRFSGPGGLANIDADILDYLDNDVFDGGAAVETALQHFLATPANQTGITDIKETDIYLSLTLQPIIDNATITNNVPGLVMAIKMPGRDTWSGVSGVSSVATGAPLTTDDRFRIGSISKTFTAMTVLRLAQEGSCDLDDLITTWLPEIKDILTKYDVDAMTIRMLLNHTNGLYNYVHDSTFQTDYRDEPLKQWAFNDFLEMANTNTITPDFAPGASWNYTNTGYTLLGMLIEELTGEDWEDVVRTKCIEPLEMQDTFVPKTGDVLMPAPYTRGYVNWDDNFNTDPSVTIPDSLQLLTERTEEDPSFANAAGAVISTPADLVVWGREIALGNTILNATYQSEHHTYVDLSIVGSPGYSYGLGIMYEGLLLGHRGQIYGYDCSVQYFAARDTTFAVCANRTLALGSNTNELVLNDVALKLYPVEFAEQANLLQ
ncbi:MAG: beta-lactamase family protein [Proteobacteria bacterium]|nr:beta-lactamase family protein [Pseudomonadota bacterium]MBU1715003.1 beta-lactamase family protein [Pseudomonadota bacterium]